jgi:hypothetical protein
MRASETRRTAHKDALSGALTPDPRYPSAAVRCAPMYIYRIISDDEAVPEMTDLEAAHIEGPSSPGGVSHHVLGWVWAQPSGV